MRKDIYDKLVAYKENGSAQDNLIPEYQRCLDRLIHNGRRNGLHLSEDTREKVKAIKKQVSELTLQFSKNLGEENTVLLFTAEELDGMVPSFLEGLEKVGITIHTIQSERYIYVILDHLSFFDP